MIELDSIHIVLAIIGQTILIGIYIGNMKTLVFRLVKDVEGLVREIKMAVIDAVTAKAKAELLANDQMRLQVKVDEISTKVQILEQRVYERHMS